MSKGYVLLNLGLYEEALIACEQVIRLDLDNAIAYLIKGRILELLAAQAYKKVREIGPGNLQVYSSSKNFIVNMEGYKSQLEPQIVTEEINEPEQR